MPARSTLRLAAATGLVAGLALSATAEVPAVLDRVPTDAAAFVAIPSIQALLADVTAFTQAHGDSLPPEMAAGLAQVGVLNLLVSQPGMDAGGSAAVVLIPTGGAPGPDGMPAMDAVGVLPITNFGAFAESPFIAGQGAQMNGGVLSVDFFGDSVFIRDLDGFAVVGNDRDLVSGFDGGKGRLAAHAKRLGTAGDRLAGSADAMVVANIEALAPQMNEAVAMAEQQAAFFAQMGGAPQLTDAVAELKAVATNFIRDAGAGLIGIDVSADGVALDLSAQFKEGSQLAGLFADSGNADPLIDNLPRMDFLIAGGVDLTHPGLRTISEGVTKLNEQLQAVAAAQGAGESPTLGFDKLAGADGFSGAVGTAPALGGGGIFANSIAYYRLDDTEDARRDLKAGVLEANGVSAAGVTYATTYAEDAQEIAGLDTDEYSVTTEIDAAGAPAGFGPLADPAMIQQMMFGFTGGPNGFIADSGNGLFMTVSKNSELLKRTIDASRGDAPTLDAAEGFQKTRRHLHEDSVAQVYVAADQIANALGPFMVMMGARDQFEPAPAMPPVGLGVNTGSGSFTLRAFIPGDVIGFAAQFAPAQDEFAPERAPGQPPF